MLKLPTPVIDYVLAEKVERDTGAVTGNNLLARNMIGRVVVAQIKNEKGKQDDKWRSNVAIFHDSLFSPYIVNGVPYQQPPLLESQNANTPPPAQQQAIPLPGTEAIPDEPEILLP